MAPLFRSTYFQYLEELTKLMLEDCVELSAEERLLLELIALRQSRNQPMMVTECMRMQRLASPATVYRKLEALRDKDWISVTQTPENRKSKFLVLSKRAEKYFQLHHVALERALKAA